MQPFKTFAPPLRPDFDYFTDGAHKPRGVAALPGKGPTWIGAYVVLPDQGGRQRLVATQLGAAVSALPDAVKGLAKKPDGTWNASATRLKAISAQLSADAASLAALTPPDVLRPVQYAAVKAISDAQSAVTKTAVALDKGVAKRGATSATILSQIAALQGRLSQVGQRLLGAVEGMIASPNATPTP